MKRSLRQQILTLMYLLAIILMIPGIAAAIPAFPGAEGFGAQSIGGRGGQVIEVTNLNDSGPGSLRAAIDASGPRTVVFRVGGTIELQSRLTIRNPYITIAGQTAPGGGVTLKNARIMTSSILIYGANDVVVRYIRVRPGPGGETDGLAIEPYNGVYPHNIIIDHCSFSWGVDGNFDIYGYNVTAQNNIIAEGLNNSTHGDGPHSTGMLINGAGTKNITVYRNLFAHCGERNPRVINNGIVDIVNNVIYNPRFAGSWGPSHVSQERGSIQVNYVKNFYKAGQDSGSADYYVSGAGQIYLNGNITPARTSDSQSEADGVIRPSNISQVVSNRHTAPVMSSLNAVDAYNAVLSDVGANAYLDSFGQRISRLDSVDSRVINDVKNGTGQIIDDPSQVGGWPTLSRGTAPVDYDRDGMPDDWENQKGLNPNNAADRNLDRDNDGYTNLEEYLNSIVVGSGGSSTLPTDPPASPPATAPGSFEFATGSASVNENAGSVNLSIKRVGGSDGAVSVMYGTQQGSALVNVDYQGVSWTAVNFASGETSKVVSVGILDDTLVEGSETFNVLLSSPAGGAALGAVATSVVTIVDNDQAVDNQAPVVTITSHQDNAQVARGSSQILEASVVDNIKVDAVEFYVDGKRLGTASSAPFKCAWDVPRKANVSYAVEVRAYDSANNIGKAKTLVVVK